MIAPVVSVAWLQQHLHDPDIRILDATYFPPGMAGSAHDRFQAGHIPGAVFFDIDAIADQQSPLPHMLPDADFFGRAVADLGIENHHRIICYDTHGMMTAARAWWMFRCFGHDRVFVLDGGFPAWQRAQGAVETGPGAATPAPHSFKAVLRPELVIAKDDLAQAITQPDFVLLDARSPGRFAGTEPEIWPGRRAGHIPGARNLPFAQLLDPATGCLHDDATLRQMFGDALLAPPGKFAVSCGSGVTACMLALGLAACGRPDIRVYDGSWAEWGLNAGENG